MTLPATDKAIWITWYDLPEEGRDAYFTWLHGSYIPRVLDRRGVLWAAHYASEERPVLTDRKEGRARRHPPADVVAQGYRFMLLVGGEDAHVFADPTPSELHGGLPAAEREMLGLRLGAATNVMIEQARVDGPEAAARQDDMALSPCIQLGSFVFDGDEDDLLGWYAQWRLPSMTELPGCIGVRKLVSVSGWAKHGILHEFTSVAARNQNFVNREREKHPDKLEWSERITGQVVHSPGAPNVATRIYSAVKG